MDKIKYQIVFENMADVDHFVTEVSGLTGDVNVYYGHQEFDGKSILALLNLELGKKYETELLSDDENMQDVFRRIVANFGG